MRAGVCLLAFISLAAVSAADGVPVRIFQGFVSENLSPHLEVLNVAGCPALSEVRSQILEKNWQGGFTRPPHFGYARSCVWARFSIANTDFTGDLFLESRAPFMDSLALYCSDGAIVSPEKSGDSHPFADRGMVHRFPNFRVHVPVKSSVVCHIRNESTSLIVIPLVLQTMEHAHKVSMPEYTGFGFYFGGIFVLLLYNLLILIFDRGRAYVWGILVLFFILVNHGLAIGFVGQFVFPGVVWISNLGPLVSSAGFSFCAFCFSRATMDIDGSAMRLRDIFLFLFFAILVAAGPLFSMQTASVCLQFSLLVVLGINVWRGIRGIRRGMFALPYFTAGWILAFMSAAVSVLYNLGAVPFLAAQTALVLIPVATILEAIFFTFALSRIRQSKSDLRTLTSSYQRSRRRGTDEEQIGKFPGQNP